MRKKELKPQISVGDTAAAVFVSNGVSVLNVVTVKKVFLPHELRKSSEPMVRCGSP